MCGDVRPTEGLEVDSPEFTFVRGPRIPGGTYDWNIGTAGSTTMLAFSVLPLACFAETAVRARLEGGVFQDFAPSPYHLQPMLAALLRRMDAVVYLEVTRPGYVPRGAGANLWIIGPFGAHGAIEGRQVDRVSKAEGVSVRQPATGA